MLLLLAPLILRGCTAITTTSEAHNEDLSQFSEGFPTCAELIGWPQVQVPLSCEDPACQGISWAVPPFRCRQRGGIMFGEEIFGCPCCPRLIDCEDPRCAGSSSKEICLSEMLIDCICIAPDRQELHLTASTNTDIASAVAAIVDIASAPETANAQEDRIIHEDMPSGNTEVTLPNREVCPQKPPVKCLDPQCRDADDWKSNTLSAQQQQCNKEVGILVVDGATSNLYGCPCCPEYIRCSSTDCNGNAQRICTSLITYGCFCDWPGKGICLFPAAYELGDGPDVLMNTLDIEFDQPNFPFIFGNQTHPTANAAAPFINTPSPSSEFGQLPTSSSITEYRNSSAAMLLREGGVLGTRNVSGLLMVDCLKQL